jgi:hypothetical protein
MYPSDNEDKLVGGGLPDLVMPNDRRLSGRG